MARTLLLTLLGIATACGGQAEPEGPSEGQIAAWESELMAADREFAEVVRTEGLSAWSSFFSPDGAVINQGVGETRGREGIQASMDQATSLGGLLSTVIEANLSVCYVADGQRVPEDLKPASRFRAGFVSQAVSLAKTFSEQSVEAVSASSGNPAGTAPSSKLHALTTDKRVASYG